MERGVLLGAGRVAARLLLHQAPGPIHTSASCCWLRWWPGPLGTGGVCGLCLSLGTGSVPQGRPLLEPFPSAGRGLGSRGADLRADGESGFIVLVWMGTIRPGAPPSSCLSLAWPPSPWSPPPSPWLPPGHHGYHCPPITMDPPPTWQWLPSTSSPSPRSPLPPSPWSPPTMVSVITTLAWTVSI